MQLSNTPGKLLLPFAADGSKNAIPVDSQIGIVAGRASLADGFPPLTRTPLSAGGVPPSGLDMNGILYEMSSVIRWANAGGGYAFDVDFATDTNVGGYPKGARLMRSDGLGYWINTVENNETDPEDAGAAAAGWVPDYTSGAAAVTMTNANVTLTPLQYGKRIILITGVLTANLNLIFPSIAGSWIVLNKCTGNFAITCKTAAGTGFAMNTGSYQFVSGEGVNLYGIGADLAMLMFTQAGAGAVARSAQGKMQETCVSVKDFGAVGNGVADDTAAFAAAIASLPGGGRIYVPRGWYRITSTLMLHSGLTFYGDGCTNMIFGVPTNNERPSHVFIDVDAGVLFGHTSGVQMESVQFFDLSFGARVSPNTTPRGTSVGFNLSGSWPNDIKHLTFERCEFSNFGAYAIRVRDPLAPHANPDWNCCPVMVTDCSFYYNAVGITFEADNADMWTFTNTFFVGNPFGIICNRSGTLLLINCFGGGAGTIMLATGNGANTVRDSITMIGCQYEDATAMLFVQDTSSTQQLYRPIRLISCVIEASITLSAACHLITDGCRWVNNLEVTATGVLIDSINDSFLNTTAFNIVAGSSVKNFITDGAQLPVGVRGPIFDGKCTHTASAPPVGGAVTYLVGDITYNSAPALGQPTGWVCVTAGAPGTWVPFGQIGFRSQSGTPVNTVTPFFAGEEFFDSTNLKWYKSRDTSGANWIALN